MEVTKKKSLMGVIVVTSLMMLFTLRYFSLYGAVISCIIPIYLYVTDVRKNKEMTNILMRKWGKWLGISMLGYFLIWVCSLNVDMKVLMKINEYNGLAFGFVFLGLFISWICNHINSEKTIMLVARNILLYVLSVFIIGYICTEHGMFSDLSWNLNNNETFSANMFIYGLAIVFLFLTLIDLIYNGRFNYGSSGIMFWSIWTIGLYIWIMLTFPQIAEKLYYNIFYIEKAEKIPVFVIVIVCSIFIVVAVWIYSMYAKAKNTDDDFIVILTTLSHFMTIPYVMNNYSKYVVVPIIVMFFSDIVIFQMDSDGDKASIHLGEISLKKNTLLSVMIPLIIAIIYKGFLNGVMDVTVMAVVGIYIIYRLHIREKERVGFIYWETIFLVFTAFFVDLYYHIRNFTENYLYLTAIVLTFSLALYIVNINNKKKSGRNCFYSSFVIGMAAILMIFTGR